jgi:hypothetical protein
MTNYNFHKHGQNDTGAYSRFRRNSALIVGILMLVASIKFSHDGFMYNSVATGFWGNVIGWGIPVAVTVAQFMFNTELKKLNLTIFAIGLAAYIYSIWTNILGLYEFRGIEFVSGKYDVINFALGFFMDIYPEAAISWSLGESRFGDLLGNIVSAAKNPERLYPNQNHSTQPNKPQNNNKPLNKEYLNKIRQSSGKSYNKPQQPVREFPKHREFPEWTPINYSNEFGDDNA